MAAPTTTAAGAGTSEPAQQSTPVDACALVTKQEAEEVAGTALGNPVAAEASCTFTGPASGPLGQFEVYVGPGAKKYLDIDVQLAHEFTKLPGIGEEALIEDGSVFLRVADTWVALRVTRLDELSAYHDELVGLAKVVAARL